MNNNKTYKCVNNHQVEELSINYVQIYFIEYLRIALCKVLAYTDFVDSMAHMQ